MATVQMAVPPLVLVLLFHLAVWLSSLPASTGQAVFSPPFAVFLACGAGGDVDLTFDSPQRTFTPDDGALSGSSSRHATKFSNPDANPPSSPLYAAARGGTRGFSYRLGYPASAAPDGNTTFVLRLHFFPFASQSGDLSTSRFNVSALGRYVLLPSFSPPRAGVVREFFLPSDGSGVFDVTFTPEAGFSFVNAIELFPAPRELLWNSAVTAVNAAAPSRQALETLYRLNVGGPLVATTNDTMWRTWLPDGSYLSSPATVSAVDSTQSPIAFDDTRGWTRMVAPDVVYKTQRTTTNSSTSNVTWTFAVDGERSYLVRLHFCAYEVLSSVVGVGLDFNVYLMQAMGTRNLMPKDFATRSMPTQAFYVDYVTTVPTGGVNLTVSIGRAATNDSKMAILNGLEIMELRTVDMNPASSSDTKNKVLIPVIAAVLSVVVVLACIASGILFVRWTLKQVPDEEESVGTPWSPFTPDGEGSVGSSMITPRRMNMKLHIPLAEIMAATGGFSHENLLGVGGFGNVYRGMLRDGTRVAVKRAQRASRQGFPEFQTEILLLSNIRHRHLPDEINLAEWAMHWSRRGRLDKVIDPSVAGDANENSLRKFAETAGRCLADYGEQRPSMGDVVWNLEYCLHLQESQASSEPLDDSGTQLPHDIIVARRVAPLAPNALVDDGEDRSWSDTASITATAHVFSQTTTGDGR
ncbi:hypothetical protein ABZP36_010528 [Zizania latifolia]